MNTSSEQGVQGAPLSSGTPAFMPPERLKRRQNSCSCSLRHSKTATDVWSMGVTLYCLCYGSLPFKSDSLSKLHDTIQRSRYAYLPILRDGIAYQNDAFLSVEYPSNCSEGLRDLLQGMLTKEACKRMSVKDILVSTVTTIFSFLKTNLTHIPHRLIHGYVIKYDLSYFHHPGLTLR